MEININKFLRKSSFTGLLVLYYAKLSYGKRIAFTKLSLQQIENNQQYNYAYLVACRATGLIDYTLHKGIINITEFDSELSEKIKSALEEKSKNLDEINKTTTNSEAIKNVEKLV